MPDYQIGSTKLWGHQSREEFIKDVQAATDVRERTAARAWKHMRLPEMYGTPASSACTIGASGASDTTVGPESGYAWSLRRIVVDGMTSGTTPDVINMYRNSTGTAPLCQFNGNNFGYTFGRLELVLKDGDTLMFASSGTFASTSRIRVSGELIEVPAEQLWKLD